MSMRSFDTYEYVQELIRGGFSQELAEANMHALVKAFDFTIEHKLVTQHEFQKVILKLDSFENKFATKEELQIAVSKIEKGMHQMEHRLGSKIQNLDHKIDKVFLKTVVTLETSMAVMMTLSCSILGYLIKF